MLRIYNTLTRKKEEFKPQEPKTVKMYTCGVTVYDDCHIGHARSLCIFDVMKRYLTWRGYTVRFVRNITDVDDKIINKARDLAQRESMSLSEAFASVRTKYIDSYYEDLKRLSIAPAEHEPRATENIEEMIVFIEKLIEKGVAYEREGNVYFCVRKFPSYGVLSGKKIDDLYSSVRIEEDSLKADPLDFALWKRAKEDEPHWVSPWGKGRPGWHIECSVMSQKFLKTNTLDVHGGGRDLIFPHHENERAQSEAMGSGVFARYWIHHGLLTIDQQKMAKSLGNFVTIKEALKRYPADVLKLFYLQAHYGHPIDFSWERMEEARRAYERIDIVRGKLNRRLKEVNRGNQTPWGLEASGRYFRDEFIEAMDDDFNMPKALAVLFGIVSACNEELETSGSDNVQRLAYASCVIDEIIDVFGLSFAKKALTGISDQEIEEKIKLRRACREQRDFSRADEIRKELESKGIILEDTKGGTEWRRKV